MLVIAAFGGGGLGLLAVSLYAWVRIRDNRFRQRLRRSASLIASQEAAEPQAVGDSIFHPVEGRSSFARVWDFVGSRYPLLNARSALPKALGLGFVGGVGLWFSMWFLDIQYGWWTMPTVGVAGAAAAWYAISWFQARQASEFIRQFPEIVDQIVRLASAGVPPLEAIAVVAEDAQAPVAPILRNIRDQLMAGLDVDTTLRAASERIRLAEFALFAAVIRLQRRAGGGVSEAFSNLATTLRERRSTALKARASTAQTRLTILVLAVMPVAVLVAQKFIAPQSVDILLGTEQGKTLLRWGVGLIITGILIARMIAARSMK